jgi:putative transposase
VEEGRPPQAELEEIADADWRKAEQRFAAIQPLADRHLYGRQEVEARAREMGVSPATLYRWLQRYQATGSVLGLLPQRRGWRRGRGRIPLKSWLGLN